MTQPPPMPASNGGAPPEPDHVSLVAIVNVLLRHRRMLVVLPVLFATIVGVRALQEDRMYTASATFMPQLAESRAGGAASLARQFGINVGGTERPGQSPQFYADLVREREILRQAVETEYRIPAGDGGLRVASLVEVYDVEGDAVVPRWRKAADRLRGSVSASVARETGVVQFTVTAFHPRLAEQIADRLLELLNEFNLETRQSQARAEGDFVERRLAEARAELHEAEGSLETFYRQNRQFERSPELRLEHDRLQRQLAILNDVVSSLAQSREQARIDAVRDTPVITVIASPIGSAQPRGRGTVRRVVLAFLLGLMLAVSVAFVSEYVRRTRNRDEDELREFDRLKREMRADLRRPTRLIRPARSAAPPPG